MLLEVGGNRLDTFADAIANDQKKKSTAPKVGSQCIIECYFIDLMACFLEKRQKWIAGQVSAFSHLSLQV